MPVGKWFALRDSNFRRSSSYVSILLIRRNLRTVRLFCGTNVGPNFAQDKRTGRVITSSAILCLCWNQLSQMEILPRLTSIASSKSFSLIDLPQLPARETKLRADSCFHSFARFADRHEEILVRTCRVLLAISDSLCRG